MHISLFIICLSNEKEEDEFVMHVRMGIIKKIIFFWFAVSFLQLIFNGIYFNFLSSETMYHITKTAESLTDVYVLILVYIAWLKSKLSKLRKEAARD